MAFGMLNLVAASCAFARSREAMAAISLQLPFCIAGITFFTAIPATPSTPHLTFCLFILFPWYSALPYWLALILLSCIWFAGLSRGRCRECHPDDRFHAGAAPKDFAIPPLEPRACCLQI